MLYANILGIVEVITVIEHILLSLLDGPLTIARNNQVKPAQKWKKNILDLNN